MQEPDGLYLWLQLDGAPEPRAYRLPWDQRMAAAAAAALEEAQRNGTAVRMRLPFEPTLDHREPKFYAPPQPALPPKDLARAAGADLPAAGPERLSRIARATARPRRKDLWAGGTPGDAHATRDAGGTGDDPGRCDRVRRRGNQRADDAVALQGCPVAGVTAGCVMVVAPDGRTWDITAADPLPALAGRPIRLTGMPSGEMSICMQGTRLTRIAWSYTAGSC